MGLNKTLTATCDHPGCKAEISLNPDTTQPWLNLGDHHWATSPKAKTFCPSHAKDAAR